MVLRPSHYLDGVPTASFYPDAYPPVCAGDVVNAVLMYLYCQRVRVWAPLVVCFSRLTTRRIRL